MDKTAAKELELLNKLLQEDDENELAHYLKSSLLTKTKKIDEAIKELDRAIELNAENYLYWYDRGKLYFLKKNYDHAISDFEKSCSLNNMFEPSYYNLGFSNEKIERYNDAILNYNIAIEINNMYEKAYLQKARVLVKQKKNEQAVEVYDKIIQLFPNNSFATQELASLYAESKDYVHAEELYRVALDKIKKTEDIVITKYNLSAVLLAQNKYEQAADYALSSYTMSEAISDPVIRSNVIYNYAFVSEKNGKKALAEQCYREAIKINPRHFKSEINLGAILLAKNPPETDEAVVLLEAAQKLVPDNFEAANNLGSAWLIKEEYAKAVSCFEKAYSLSQENIELKKNLAKAYAGSKNYAKAKDFYSSLIKTEPENWSLFLELAKVCLGSGDVEGAEKYLLYLHSKAPDFKSQEVESLLAEIEG